MVGKRTISYKKISLAVTAVFLLCFAMLSTGYFITKQSADVSKVPIETKVVEEPKNENFTFRNKEHFDNPKKMPDVSFVSPEGKTVSWNDFEGKYTLVNIWATWCSPCVVELPTLQKLGEIFEDEMNVIAISADMVGGQERIREFLKQRNISDFALYLDKNKDIQKKIPIRGLPTTFLLNPKGELLYVFEGEANWSAPPGVEFFSQLLKKNY